MRILHTSDWHLGRTFGDHRLLDDQAAFLDWLIDLVSQERVDLVVVAGDLYDRAIPPVAAVSLLGDSLRRLTSAGVRVVAIAGNHDSADRVGSLDGLTDASGVILRGGYRRAGELVLLDLADGQLAVAPVPFLDPLLAPADEAAPPGSNDESSPSRRHTHHSVLAARLSAALAALPPSVPTLAVAHAFVAGGLSSGSERELSLGGLDHVTPAVFEGFDYVALGHLHRPQTVAGRPHLRYSGSPLAYSFTETAAKHVVLVDLQPAEPPRIETVPIPVGRRVASFGGAFADLCIDPRLDIHRDSWVRVELTDDAPVLDAHRRLRERFPFLVEIDRVGMGGGATDERPTVGTVRSAQPVELAESFWASSTGADPDHEIRELLTSALARGTNPVEVDR